MKTVILTRETTSATLTARRGTVLLAAARADEDRPFQLYGKDGLLGGPIGKAEFFARWSWMVSFVEHELGISVSPSSWERAYESLTNEPETTWAGA